MALISKATSEKMTKVERHGDLPNERNNLLLDSKHAYENREDYSMQRRKSREDVGRHHRQTSKSIIQIHHVLSTLQKQSKPRTIDSSFHWQ